MNAKTSPLIYPAVALSAASLAWTTWSLVDLLGTGLIGLTVAAGADVIWASVILAEARGLRVAGKAWAVPAVGWATLLVVAALLAWHGVAAGSTAVAVAGPFLPLGAKGVWTLALADMRDPAALTDDQRYALAEMGRGMTFDEAKHDIEMRRRAMGAELLMAEVSTDFDIELMRQDKTRELARRRPLELPPAEVARASQISRVEDSENFASLASETADSVDAKSAGHATATGEAFGFAAALGQRETSRRVLRPRQAKASPPRKAKQKAKAAQRKDPRVAALADYRASVEDGDPLSGAELGRRYGRTARWGQQLIAEAKND